MKQTARDWLLRLAKGDRRRRLLIGLGLAGILLIALTELLPRFREDDGTVPASSDTALNVSEAEQALEKRITDMVGQIEGVGECRVMVTLENGVRYLYATDVSDASDEKTVVVETSHGPVGLLVTQLQPTVKGVAVVCSGGGNDAVCQRVVDLVSTALHISSRQVCVVAKE